MLKEQRIRRGYTQEFLSNVTGIGIDTIRAYEQGKRDINKIGIDKMLKICNVLCCNIEDILTDEKLIQRMIDIKLMNGKDYK